MFHPARVIIAVLLGWPLAAAGVLTFATQLQAQTWPPIAQRTAPTGLEQFPHFSTPGDYAFAILANVYAPPMDDLPAQVFLGTWTAGAGADIAVWEPESGLWRGLALKGVNLTRALYNDPYRPIVYLSAPRKLYEIDRRTLVAKPVADIPSCAMADFDRQGRLWLVKGRNLHCYDPRDRSLTDHSATFMPDELYYPEDTYSQIAVGRDGRIWFTQQPRTGLSVYDPASRQTTIVWRAQPGEEFKGQSHHRMPIVIGDTVCYPPIFADARTNQIIAPPYAFDDQDGFHLLARNLWRRTPSSLLDRDGQALARQRDVVGWLEPASGKFQPIGQIPQLPPIAGLAKGDRGTGWSLHGDHTLLGGTGSDIFRINLASATLDVVPLAYKPKFANGLWSVHIGPDDLAYVCCVVHDLLRIGPDGVATNLGNPVRIRSGELQAMRHVGNRLYISAYTGSTLTRLDLDRPADNWGTDPEHNPRSMLDLAGQGQHRPTEMDVMPDGVIYWTSRSDYCDRREGALIIVGTDPERVEQVVDPLIPGEQLFPLVCSRTRPEVYIGTSEGSFVVWDHANRRIKAIHKLSQRAGDGTMTGTMQKIGGVRFLAIAGDLVLGCRLGGYELFAYHADTGRIEELGVHPNGKAFYLYSWRKRGTIIVRLNSTLYEVDSQGRWSVLVNEPLPGLMMCEDSTGRLFMYSGTSLHRERLPLVEQLPAPITH